jgi:O-antigen ligase
MTDTLLELRRPRSVDLGRLLDAWPSLLIGIALMANYTLAVVQLPIVNIGLIPATIAFVLSVLLLARALWVRDTQVKLPPMSKGLVLTVLWVLLSFPSVLLSLDAPLSLRLTLWLPFYSLVGVVAASYIWTRGRDGARRILLVAWYAGVAYSVWGLVVLESFVLGHDFGQYVVANGIRITSLTGEANSFGAYLSLIVPIGFALATEKNSSTLVKATLPLVLAVALLTFSRGLWVAVVGTTLVFIVADGFRVRSALRVMTYPVAAVLICLVFFVQFPTLGSFLADRFQTAPSMALTGEGSRAVVLEAGLRALVGNASPGAPAASSSPSLFPSPSASTASAAPIASTAPSAAVPPSSVQDAANKAVSSIIASDRLKLFFGIGQGAPVRDIGELGLSTFVDQRGRGQLLFLHNLYAQVLVSSGLLATIVFVGLLLYELWASLRLLRKLARSERALLLAGLVSLVGVLLMGFSFDILLAPYLFLALAWNRAIREIQSKSDGFAPSG